MQSANIILMSYLNNLQGDWINIVVTNRRVGALSGYSSFSDSETSCQESLP